MRFAGRPSWRMTEDMSWPLTVALHIRDAVTPPGMEPFFIPPLVPKVPGHTSSDTRDRESMLAGEWAVWFDELLTAHLDMPRGSTVEHFSLDGRTPEFRNVVEGLFGAATAAADAARDNYIRTVVRNIGTNLAMTRLVESIEQQIGRKAAPFTLNVLILPAQGHWLHRTGPRQVLMSQAVRKDTGQLLRLLGPILKELAR